MNTVPGAEATRRPTAQEFRDAIGRFATGVTVITTRDQGRPLGTTASAVSSVSLEPPTVLICMNKTSVTGQAIVRSGLFAINILAEDQRRLAEHFASKDPEKFQPIEDTPGVHGQPLLTDALATLECRVSADVTGGTHTVFLAEVVSATSREGRPLAHFRGKFGRFESSAEAPT